MTEGTPIIEYPHVPADERNESIELVEDLVIGGGETDDPSYAFYHPRGLAVDDAGNIYVAEAGDHHVRVYDRDGAFVRSFGREGQGPGETERFAELPDPAPVWYPSRDSAGRIALSIAPAEPTIGRPVVLLALTSI